MLKKLLLLMLFCSFLIGQNVNERTIELVRIELIVKNLTNSSNWYINNLGLERKDKNDNTMFLANDSFELLLKENKYALTEQMFQLPKGVEFIDGYSKIGFATNNINNLYTSLLKKKVTVFRELTKGDFFEGEYFIVTDPDGNFIQIFSNSSQTNKNVTILKPFMIGKVVSNIDKQINWFTKIFNSKLTELFDMQEFKIKIGYLEINNIYFELLETKVSAAKSALNIKSTRENLLGISSITFKVKSDDPILKNTDLKNSNNIFYIIDNNEDLLKFIFE